MEESTIGESKLHIHRIHFYNLKETSKIGKEERDSPNQKSQFSPSNCLFPSKVKLFSIVYFPTA